MFSAEDIGSPKRKFHVTDEHILLTWFSDFQPTLLACTKKPLNVLLPSTCTRYPDQNIESFESSIPQELNVQKLLTVRAQESMYMTDAAMVNFSQRRIVMTFA